MKKYRMLLLTVISISLIIVGCGNKNKNEEQYKDDFVRLIVPIEMITLGDESIDPNDIKAKAEENGMEEVIINDNGTFTYIMSSEKQEGLLESISLSIDQLVEELSNSDIYPGIKEVTMSKEYDDLELLVIKGEVENGFTTNAVKQVILQTSYYQIFSGIAYEDLSTVVKYKDFDSGQIYTEIVFP